MFINNFDLRVVKKHSTHRGEQRSYSKNFDILSIRNEQIANYFLEFGAGFGINYDKIPKKFSWIRNGIPAEADISGLKVDDICKFYRYIHFPQIAKYTGYQDTYFTSLLIKQW